MKALARQIVNGDFGGDIQAFERAARRLAQLVLSEKPGLQFKLEVDLENEAMDGAGLAIVLIDLIPHVCGWTSEDDLLGRKVFDLNGNAVGYWEITNG